MLHNFGEQESEYSVKQRERIPVWRTPKFEISRKKAIETIESGKYGLEDGDFWILMNETKSGKMAYTGLITSHNACLKINDTLESRFRPECVSVDKEGYNGSLVYSYCSPEQGIYEVGEASPQNCKNTYPYAMAYKRLFDRVVLKLSKLAYSGVYSESEAEEIQNPLYDSEAKPKAEILQKTTGTASPQVNELLRECRRVGVKISELCKIYGIDSIQDFPADKINKIMEALKRRPDKEASA